MRYIGIRHRVKRTADGEARPTQVYTIDGEHAKARMLETEDDELRFLAEVREGDVIALTFGGSGGYFAYALGRAAEKVKATVIRIAPFRLKAVREGAEKDYDARLLAELGRDRRELFFDLTDRDRTTILIRELSREHRDTQKDRIRCGNRLFARSIGMAFVCHDGVYPEGGIEKAFDAVKANSPTLKALVAEEKRVVGELQTALDASLVYYRIFKPIVGCGPIIAGAIIGGIEDIRRFGSAEQLVSYCGVGTVADKDDPTKRKLAKRRGGEVANWNGGIRQSLFQLADQFNRRPESDWGKKLRENKARILESVVARNPEHEADIRAGKGMKQANGKSIYSKMHLHKMGLWRTLTQFVGDYVYPEWVKLEGGTPQPRKVHARLNGEDRIGV